jgi:diguanylate cyclase (GGDEF)-like protein
MHDGEPTGQQPEFDIDALPPEARRHFVDLAALCGSLTVELANARDRASDLEGQNSALQERVDELEETNTELRGWVISEDAWEQMLETARAAVRSRKLIERHRKITQAQHLEIIELRSAVEKAENTDQMTGLLNSRGLEIAYDNLVQQKLLKRRGYEQSTMLFLDLDKFKTINDTLGHFVGDEVLKQVAERLKKRLREDDILGRKGGDEFVIILPFTTPEDSVALAKELLTIIGELTEVDGIQLPHNFGVSIGVSRMKPELTFAGSASIANEAMKSAKQTGRNKVIYIDK